MASEIPETDWKIFKQLHQKLLQEYCAGVLKEIEALIYNQEGSAHERYLAVYKLLERRDRQMADAFDDYRRSTAVIQLGMMRRMKLLSDEDLQLLSEQTRFRIETMASL